MPLQSRLSDLITAIKGSFNGLDARVTTLEGAGGGGGAMFPIWAEENGAIANNGWEYSFGNGATGNDIGIPLAYDCQLERVSINADVPGTTAVFLIYNGATQVYATPAMANNGVNVLPAPITFSQGDLLVFRTGPLVGSWTDVRVCAWFREI